MAVSRMQRLAVAIFFVAATFLAVTLADIAIVNRISPWHDEIWNLYASFRLLGIRSAIWPGCEQQMCISVLGLRIPVLSGPYHGVIKTILFAPLVLPGEIGLIRVANIAAYLAPIIYVAKQKREIGAGGVIFLAISYILLFPGLIFEAAFDQGQFIVAGALLTIAAIELAKDMDEHRPVRVVLASLLCALAVYEKLTTIPAAAALSAVAAFRLMQYRQWRAMAVAGCGLLLFLPYVRYVSSNYATISGMTNVERLPYFYGFMITLQTIKQALFTTVYTASQILGHNLNLKGAVLAGCMVSVIWIISLLDMRRSNIAARSLLALAPLTAIALYPLLGGLYRPWHVYQIAPLAMGPLALIAIRARDNATRQSGLSVMALLIALVGLVNSISIAKGVVNRQRAHPFDATLFPVVQAIKSNGRAQAIICPDYSVCYQTAFMLGSSFRIQAEFAFSPKADVCKLIEDQPKPFYVISHPSGRLPNDRYPDFMTELSHSRSDAFLAECGTRFMEIYSSEPRMAPGYRVLLAQ